MRDYRMNDSTGREGRRISREGRFWRPVGKDGRMDVGTQVGSGQFTIDRGGCHGTVINRSPTGVLADASRTSGSRQGGRRWGDQIWATPPQV